MPKGEEDKLAEKVLPHFKKIGQEFSLCTKDKIKLLMDFTCIKEKNEFKLGLGFAQVDIAIFSCIKFNKSNKAIKESFKFIQDDPSTPSFLRIPFCVVELKTGKSITTDSIRTRDVTAEKIKEIFPFCYYIFIGDKTNKKDETFLRHGKSFDHFFLFKHEISCNNINTIISNYVKPHLMNLKNMEILV